MSGPSWRDCAPLVCWPTRATVSRADQPGGALPLTRLEQATGLPFEDQPGPGARLPPWTGASPWEALERELTAALARPPCLVSFSGGRDSSAVLAAATRVARQQGLPLPIPATLRFPGRSRTDENSWQELVVSHLKLPHWEQLAMQDELDLLGPVATAALQDHGLLWPPNAHFHVPLLELARGGSLLTGYDGDGAFGSWRYAGAQALLHGRAAPTLRHLKWAGFGLAPPLVRRLVRPSWPLPWVTWLRPRAQAAATEAAGAAAATEPRRWDRWLGWYAARRYHRLAVHSIAVLAAARDVRAFHPLIAPSFLSALAAEGGPAGYGERTGVMRKLFGAVLPEALLSRRSKAEFSQAIWRGAAQEFADQWTGAGVDARLVRVEPLREAWRRDMPPLASATLLHIAWLAASRPALQQRLNRPV